MAPAAEEVGLLVFNPKLVKNRVWNFTAAVVTLEKGDCG